MSEPFVTVVLAVRNESAFIARCLGAVLAQNWPAEQLEILVADGESTDGTPDIIRALLGSERIQLITNPGRRQAAGLNAAIARARGDVIVRVDGHTQIAPDYVRRCVAALEETDAACVGGRIEPIGITPVGAVIAAAAHTAFAVPGAFHVSQTARFTDTVYMGAWPANVLARSGGFDERLRANEDYELAYRIRQSGGSVYLSPAICSMYFGRQMLTALARQYFVYGIGKAQVLRKYPKSLRMRRARRATLRCWGTRWGGLLVSRAYHPFALADHATRLYLAQSWLFGVRCDSRALTLRLAIAHGVSHDPPVLGDRLLDRIAAMCPFAIAPASPQPFTFTSCVAPVRSAYF